MLTPRFRRRQARQRAPLPSRRPAVSNSTIRDGHPRVLLRPDDLPALRRRALTTHAPQMRSLITLAGVGGDPGSDPDHSDTVYRLAFLHLLTNESAHARPAIDALHQLLD